MIRRYGWASALLAVTTMTGCPTLEPTRADPSAGAAGTIARLQGGALAVGGARAIERLVNQAARDRFPPPPQLATLCQLQPGNTTFDVAKKILAAAREADGYTYPGAKPQSESQDAMMAGLAYRFSGLQKDEPDDDDQVRAPDTVSLILRFSWSDGSPGTGTIIFGIGGSPEDLITGYVLKDMSLTGLPYPGCWPHEEE